MRTCADRWADCHLQVIPKNTKALLKKVNDWLLEHSLLFDITQKDSCTYYITSRTTFFGPSLIRAWALPPMWMIGPCAVLSAAESSHCELGSLLTSPTSCSKVTSNTSVSIPFGIAIYALRSLGFREMHETALIPWLGWWCFAGRWRIQTVTYNWRCNNENLQAYSSVVLVSHAATLYRPTWLSLKEYTNFRKICEYFNSSILARELMQHLLDSHCTSLLHTSSSLRNISWEMIYCSKGVRVSDRQIFRDTIWNYWLDGKLYYSTFTSC